jgi:hypothetical protein
MVVDTNMGFNKTDLNIDRLLAYHINMADLTRPYSMLNVYYTNRSEGLGPGKICPIEEELVFETYAERADDCYANYQRLYLPEGSTLLNPPYFTFPPAYTYGDNPGAGKVQAITDERQKEVFGGLMVVSPGELVRASYIYRLEPYRIFTQVQPNLLHYNLMIYKQAGARPYPFTVTVDLPPGVGVANVSPQPLYGDRQTLHFQGLLDRDIEISFDMVIPDALQSGLTEDSRYPLPVQSALLATATPRFESTQGPYEVVDLEAMLLTPTSTSTPAPTPTHTPTPITNIDTTVEVMTFLYAKPGFGGDILARLYPGSSVVVVGSETSGEWFYCRTEVGNAEGWVWGESLMLEIPIPNLLVIQP